jgi:hypothetical protein
MQEPRVPGASGNPMGDRFMQMDTNGDGKISLSDEVSEQARQFLERLDTNSDGFIDSGEMGQASQQMRGGGRGGRGNFGGQGGPGGGGGFGAPGGAGGGRRSSNRGGGPDPTSEREQAF